MKIPQPAARALVLGLMLGIGIGACNNGRCPDDQKLAIKLEGTCHTSPTATLRLTGCDVRFESEEGSQDLPPGGSIDAEHHTLRQGGWLLYGPLCAKGQKDYCTGEYRVCGARRGQSWLDVECYRLEGGDTTTPVCQTRITE